MFDPPPVKWAVADGTSIAYHAFGDGPVDLVIVSGIGSHIEMAWELPGSGSFLERLGRFARVLLIEKRGGGLSDRLVDYPPLEVRMSDVVTVMDQENVERAFLMGLSEGGTMCALAAATFPDRFMGLILWGAFARYTRADDYPYGRTDEQLLANVDATNHLWGRPEHPSHAAFAPSLAGNPEWARLWAKNLRLAMTPTGVRRAWELISEMDARPVLASIHAPTLLMHRVGDRIVPVEMGRYLAEAIPNAKLVEFDGD